MKVLPIRNNFNFQRIKKIYIDFRPYQNIAKTNESEISDSVTISDNKIIPFDKIEKDIGIKRDYWYRAECFNGTYIEKNGKKIPALDLNDELNRENLSRIQAKIGDLAGKDIIVKKFNVSNREFVNWLNMNFLKSLTLKSKDNEEIKTYLIDISDKENLKTIEMLTRKRSKLNERIITSRASRFLEPVENLDKLGFGSKDILINLFNEGKLKGICYKDDDKTGIYIDLFNTQNEVILSGLRQKRSIDEFKAKEKYGVDTYDFYKNVRDGKLTILKGVFAGDLGSLQVDMAKKQNRENFLKLIALSLVHKKLILDSDECLENIFMVILDSLYPQLSEDALKIAKNDKELLNALKRKVDFDRNCDLKKILSEQDEIEIKNESVYSYNPPTQRQYRKIEIFDEKMLEKIDIAELEQYIKLSLKYGNIYKNSGVKGVDNENVKKAIVKFRQNHKTNTKSELT